MDKLSTKILAKIKSEKIKPKPRWQFLLKESVTWATFTLSILVGSLGAAIVFYLLENNGDLFSLQAIFLSIPFFWLAIFIFFIFLAYYNFKHTPDGYKYNVFKILAVSLFFSIILGWIINFSGFAGKINTNLDNIPYYSQLADPRYSVWMRPQEGYLAGKIISINDDNTLTIADLNEKNWTVDISSALIRPSAQIDIGNQIKILGKLESGQNFKANEIRPWSGKMVGNIKGISQNHYR